MLQKNVGKEILNNPRGALEYAAKKELQHQVKIKNLLLRPLPML